MYCAVVTPETTTVCPTASPCAALVVKVTADADEEIAEEFLVKMTEPVAVAAPRFAAVATVNSVVDDTVYTVQGALYVACKVTDDGVPDTVAGRVQAVGQMFVMVYENVVGDGTVQTQYVVAAVGPVKPATDTN